jgi:phage shock protein A
MNAFAKFSTALLLMAAAAVGAYLYLAPNDEGFDAARSQPQDPICKQDGERLARLRAHPSLDEGLSFVAEIKCMQLWPQLQTVMDDLSAPSRSTASTSPNGAAPDTPSASTATPAATSTGLDDACKHDEDRLAELQANPSVNAAIRFDSELRCPRLQPQLPAILAKLSHNGGSVEAVNPTAPAPDTMSAGQTAPPAAESPAGGAASAPAPDTAGTAVPTATEAQTTDTASKTLLNAASLARTPEARATETTSADPDDPCKQDEERLAALQAKPSLDDAVRFQGELKCFRLQPQLLAVLDSLSQAAATEPRSTAGTPGPSAAPSDTAPIGAAPVSDPPSPGAAPNASDDACKQDAARLGRLRETPSTDEAARFAQELRCETLRPQLLALTDGLAKPLPDSGTASKDAKNAAANDTPPAVDTTTASQSAVDADRRIAALESDKKALGEKVSQLEHDREAASAEQASPPASPQPAPPVERSKTDPASQAAVEAERRIAQLESQQAALTAKVSQLERDRETAPARQGDPPAPPQPAPVAEQFQSEPASHAAVEAERRIAELESEKGALTAELGRLQRHDDGPSPAPSNSTPPPQPGVPTERSDSEPLAAEASLPRDMPARVLIRYLANNVDARAQAEKLARALRGRGVEVADLRESAGANRIELSYSYAPDEAIALEVGRLAGVAPVRRIQPKDGLMVRPGTVELNLSGDSHTAPIKTTLRRETNHE